MVKIQELEEKKEQVEHLTNLIGGEICASRYYCSERDIDNCSKCNCGKVFKQIAVGLYKKGVRLPVKQRRANTDAEKEELKKTVKGLNAEVKKLKELNERYKERITTLCTQGCRKIKL